MEQTDEQARVRMWLESVRQDPTFTAPGALFSLGPAVRSLYGSFKKAHLTSERGLVEYALAYVNREDDRSEFLKDLPASSLYDDFRGIRESTETQHQLQSARFLPLLMGIVTDRKKAKVQFLPAAEKLLTRVWAVPTIYPTAHHIINDAAGFYAFLAILLLDEERGLGRALRRCELCRRFFLVRPTQGRGRPQNRFCDTKCLKQAHDVKAPERQRRVRARKLLERKYGREKSRSAVGQAFEEHPNAAVNELVEHARLLMTHSARKQK